MAKKKELEDIKKVNVDLESIKQELTDYIDEKVEKSVSTKVKEEFVSEIDKANKRLIREKNRKILVKNIFLLLFLAIILFLVFLLYKDGHFDKYFTHSSNDKEETIEKVNKNNNDKDDNKELSLEELISKYGNYIDSYGLNKNSIYLEDFYEGKLSNELMSYWTLNNMNFDKFEIEDDYQVIDSESFCKMYDNLFVEKCNPSSFDYDGHKIRYLQKMKSFMSDEILEKDNSNIEREIINISVNEDIVSIETVEAIVEDDGLFVISPYKFIGDYNGKLSSYKDELNHVTYNFKNGKLLSIGEEL